MAALAIRYGSYFSAAAFTVSGKAAMALTSAVSASPESSVQSISASS